MAFNHKHLLGIEPLSASDITTILDTAESMAEISTREIKKVPVLRGKTIISTSSVSKGETLKDTILALPIVRRKRA